MIEHLRHFAPVVVRARHLLAVHFDTAAYLKLRIERLAVGADAGIPNGRFLAAGRSSGRGCECLLRVESKCGAVTLG